MGNSYGNNVIVLDNLKFNADPANKQSYPGSGTLLYDTITPVSGLYLGKGTITNSVFRTDNSGKFAFNGTGYIEFDFPLPFFREEDNTYSADVWCNSGDRDNRSIFCYLNGDSQIIFQLMRTSNSGELVYRWYNEGLNEVTIDSAIDSASTWFNYTVVHEGGNLIIYRNGVAIKTQSGLESNLNFAEGSKFFIGSQTTTDRFWDGDISCLKFYTDALSASEVKQNYNALKHRFI